MKRVTDRVATVSKETMSRGALKVTNKKWNKLEKKLNEATSAEVTVCDDNGDDSGGEEGRTVAN